MIVQSELKRLYEELAKQEVSRIQVFGSHVVIRIFNTESKLILSSSIYHGTNFIPKSVRECISYPHPFGYQEIKTYVSVDEGHYAITLNYAGSMESMSRQKFISILEEFGYLADKWRGFLDDHDKKDLIHVRVK